MTLRVGPAIATTATSLAKADPRAAQPCGIVRTHVKSQKRKTTSPSPAAKWCAVSAPRHPAERVKDQARMVTQAPSVLRLASGRVMAARRAKPKAITNQKVTTTRKLARPAGSTSAHPQLPVAKEREEASTATTQEPKTPMIANGFVLMTTSRKTKTITSRKDAFKCALMAPQLMAAKWSLCAPIILQAMVVR